MADPQMIEVLVNEMAGCVNRRVSDEEKAGAARSIGRRLGDLSNEQLSKVTDAWIDAQSDKSPAFKLPAVSTLTEIAKRMTTGTRASRERRSWTPPSPEFVEAHRRFKVAMKAINASLLASHDHRKGSENCPVCGPDGDEVRARIQELLEGLPKPSEEERSCSAGCDGGWLKADDVIDAVSPCKICNPLYDTEGKTG